MTIDMNSWQHRPANVLLDLKLDALNARLSTSPNATQIDLRESLFAKHKALELVEAIAKVGYLPLELPIVVETNGTLVVVEGNRRVAALQAIQNPHLIPSMSTKIEKLIGSMSNRDALRTVTVQVAPDRSVANQVIASLHTGSQRLRWSPIGQANFFQWQMETGQSLQELIELYPTIDVRDFAQTASIMKLLQDAVSSDDKLLNYLRSTGFKLSTLNRLLPNQEFLNLAGLKVDPSSGSYTFTSDNEAFERVAKKVIGDMSDNKINTRVLGTQKSDSYKNYMNRLTSVASGKVDEYEDDSAVDSQTGEAAEKNSKESTRLPRGKYNRLDMTDVVPLKGYPSIEDSLRELQNLNPQDFPYAVTDLMRSVLEKSVKAYAAKKTSHIPHSGKFVFLDNCLTWLETDAKNSGNTALIQPIQKIREQRNFLGSPAINNKETLDAINHNYLFTWTTQEAVAIWKAILPLLQYIHTK